MPKFHLRREFLRMEEATVVAEDEDAALEMADEDSTIEWQPYWNQDEDWQVTAELVDEKGGAK